MQGTLHLLQDGVWTVGAYAIRDSRLERDSDVVLDASSIEAVARLQGADARLFGVHALGEQLSFCAPCQTSAQQWIDALGALSAPPDSNGLSWVEELLIQRYLEGGALAEGHTLESCDGNGGDDGDTAYHEAAADSVLWSSDSALSAECTNCGRELLPFEDGGVSGGVREGGVSGGVREGGVREGGVREGGVREGGVREGGVTAAAATPLGEVLPGGPVVCHGCGIAPYCSRACQIAGLSAHLPLCRATTNAASRARRVERFAKEGMGALLIKQPRDPLEHAALLQTAARLNLRVELYEEWGVHHAHMHIHMHMHTHAHRWAASAHRRPSCACVCALVHVYVRACIQVGSRWLDSHVQMRGQQQT